ncbi:MAG TPA: AAA domain-containing protein, partial [Thermomicrobiales bacterium]|nr:AAA domain-containing protein [Thermomicrobiales bacterium]
HLDHLTARLRREHPLETRIREDDRVLLTPHGLTPGDALSVEGTVEQLGAHEITVQLRDRLPGGVTRYRLDDIGRHDILDWQTQGLTDFLVTAMDGTPARGRAIQLRELPPLAQTILGHQVPLALPDDPPVPATISGLNAIQRRAIGAALALDLRAGAPLLIQGPPGTGKTAMIAELARAIAVKEFWKDGAASEERALLLLANSHRAVDEMVGRIVTRYPDLAPYVIRVGNAWAAMEPAVRDLVLSERVGVRDALSIEQMQERGPERLVELIRRGNAIHDGAMIFASTLASATRPELRGLRFRTVIVDENGQATEPAALQALRHLPVAYRGRLILVGDQQQLPPVVPEADNPVETALPIELKPTGLNQSDTLRTSLFERLARRYPERLMTLSEQYRMAAPICTLISETFYDGLLVPGNEAVAGRHVGETFMELGALLPDALITSSPPVVLLDTARDPMARDSVARGGGEDARENGREADLIARLIRELFVGLPGEKRSDLAAGIGVISPYRRQNNRIRRSLAALDPWLADAIRVDTVDRFQGGERDIILVSLTNSNSGGTIGSLHADWRRMNVALSRARRSLVIVGDRRTFTRPGGESEEPAKERYRRLFSVMDGLAAEHQARVIPSRGLWPDG